MSHMSAHYLLIEYLLDKMTIDFNVFNPFMERRIGRITNNRLTIIINHIKEADV